MRKGGFYLCVGALILLSSGDGWFIHVRKGGMAIWHIVKC